MPTTSDKTGVLRPGSDLPTADGPTSLAGSRSRHCVFDLDDHQFGDLVYGGLGPTLVAFAHHGDPHRATLQGVMEELGTDRLRCVLADPDACPSAASRLVGPGQSRYLLFINGQQVEGFDTRTDGAVLVKLIAQASEQRRT